MDVLDKSVEYDKALARAKDLINEKSADDICRKIVEHIFPQLKETVEEKDVRISKSIIECLKGTMPDNEYRREYISWLENHGSMMTFQEEHKFNIGEWIIYDNMLKVVDIKPHEYVLQFWDGKEITDDISYVDKFYRLWTIEDAKDGDVLVHSSFLFDDFIFIYNNTSTLQAYCYYSKERDRFIIEDRGHYCPWNMQEVTPATKEQRDTLFAKMKEKSFKWDAKKKELVNS